MLKQGRLKPMVTGTRNWKWIPIAVIAFSLPLSGLRGKPPQTENASAPEDKTAAVIPVNSASDNSITLSGTLVYRPGKMEESVPGHVGRWLNTVLQFAMLGVESNLDESLTGNASLVVKWQGETMEHGMLTLGTSVKNAEKFAPKIISKLAQRFTNAAPESRVITKKMINGHEVTGFVQCKYDPASKAWIQPEDTTPESWVLDSEVGYYSGTLEEIETFLKTGKKRELQIPAEMKADFDSAYAGIVFDDMQQWLNDLNKALAESPRRGEFGMIMPALKGLTQVGGFVTGGEAPDAILRFVYDTEPSAATAHATLDALLAVALAAYKEELERSSDPMARQLLPYMNSLTINKLGNVLQLETRISVLEPAISMAVKDVQQGWSCSSWTDMSSTFKVESSNGRTTYRLPSNKTTGSAAPSYLVQCIDATKFRNKRIRLSVDADIASKDSANAGLLIWAADAKRKSVAFTSNSIDGSQNLCDVISWHTLMPEVIADYQEDIQPMTSSTEMDVPADADVISFGLYSGHLANDLLVRGFTISEVGDATNTASEEAPFATNVFMMPGFVLNAEPKDMHFESAKVTTETESSSPTEEIATQGNDKTVR